MLLRQRRVLPIALVLRPGAGGLTWKAYTEELFGRELLTFRYGQVGIRDLPMGGYAVQEDPVAGALSMLMAADEAEQPVQKLAVLQKIIASGLTDGNKLFLIELISIYLPTADLVDLGGSVMEQIADIELTVFEKMRRDSRREGLEEGREEGEMLGKRLLLQRLLTHKFGELPEDVSARIATISDDETFDSLVEQALTAATLAELTFPAALTGDETE